jgi:cytidine deaminase
MTAASGDRDLLAAARDARETAYAPYSEFPVGAALRTDDGTVFTGCNVENANFTNSLHAEAVALGSAVAAGHRDFAALAVAGGAQNDVLPCGACRQTLVEFCDPSFPIVVADPDATTPVRHRLGDLLPDPIGPADLEVSDDAR